MFVDGLTMTAEVSELLQDAVGSAGLTRYESDPEARVGGWSVEDRLVSAVVVRVERCDVELLHIATRRASRGMGYGEELVRAIAARFAPRAVIAETDDDAVGFYRRLDFVVEEIESPWQVSRYRCVRSKQVTGQ